MVSMLDKNNNNKKTIIYRHFGGDMDEAMKIKDMFINKYEENSEDGYLFEDDEFLENEHEGIIYKAINDGNNKFDTKKLSQTYLPDIRQSKFTCDESRLFFKQLNEVEMMCEAELKNIEHLQKQIQPLNDILEDTEKFKGLSSFSIPSSLSLRNNNNDDEEQRREDNNEEEFTGGEKDNYALLSGVPIPYSKALENKRK